MKARAAAHRAHAARFPAELQPNPGYQYEPPAEVMVGGMRCIEVDAGVIPWARDIATRSLNQKFPKPSK